MWCHSEFPIAGDGKAKGGETRKTLRVLTQLMWVVIAYVKTREV